MQSRSLLRIISPALNLPRTKLVVLFALVQGFRRLALAKQLGSGIDRDAGEPGREFGSSLETAHVFEGLQKHVLGNIPGVVHVPEKA